MFFLISLIIFAVLLHSVYNNRSLDAISRRILLIYIAIWGADICCSSLGLFGLNIPSLKLRCFLIGHVIAFVIGYRSVKISSCTAKAFSLEKLNTRLCRVTDSPVFKIISLVLTVYVISLVAVYFRTLALISLADMRTDYYEGNLYGGLFSMINGPILSVFNMISLPIFAWMLLYKRNFYTIVLGIYLVGYVSLGGGRFGYIILLIEFIFVAFCVYLNKDNKSLRIKQILAIGGVMLVLIAAVTSLRLDIPVEKDNAIDSLNEVTATTSEQMYCYFVAPLSALDYAIENNYVDRINGYQYGGLTLSSAQIILYSLLNKIGLRYDNTDMNKMVSIKQDEYIKIGSDSYWNALYSANLYYYLDFGYLGIIIFPLFWGVLIRHIIKQMYRYSSVPFFILAAVAFNTMVLSFVEFRFTGVFMLIAVIILYFLGKSRLSIK